MGLFERFLSVWVGIAIFLGVLIGSAAPSIFLIISKLEFAHINFVIAILIWIMIYPMMVQIDIKSIKRIGKKPKGLFLTLFINWLIKPFSMAILGWLFFKVIFYNLVSPEDATEFIAGMILLGVAPCTAMVFVWSQLTKGCANYTLVQVSVNDLIMVFAFAPLTALLLGTTDITVPWETLILSVVLYVMLPLTAGVVTRYVLNGEKIKLDNFLRSVKPFSVIGLLLTVFILFGLQANTILSKPMVIVLIAIPLVIQTYGIFFIAYFLAYKLRLPHNIAAPASMIGTSNFFELAVAVAIALFGLNSGAALATVVGVLVEVPVMLSLVWLVNRTRSYFSIFSEE